MGGELLMSTQVEKFKAIADAIRLKTGSQDDIIANDFESKILSMDVSKQTTLYPDGLDNGYCGVLAARAAASYHFARVSGLDVFDYVQYSNNVLNTRTNPENANYGTARVRDSQGRGLLDCSSFVGLALRGVSYFNSPFTNDTYYDEETKERHWHPGDYYATPTLENRYGQLPGLKSMYGNTGWEFKIFDQQPDGEFRYLGFENYSSLRGAGHIAEFFYKYGHVIYNREKDGTLADEKNTLNDFGNSILNKLQPGDIIFMSNYDIDFLRGGRRFRAISHIAIVAEDASRYFHVVGSDENIKNEKTVLYDNFSNRSHQISLICRPDYLHNCRLALDNETNSNKKKLLNSLIAKKIPNSINLLSYPWYFTYNTENYETTKKVGYLTVDITDMNSMKIYGGSNNGSTSVYLRGGSSVLKLPKGTYQLSGMESATDLTSSAKLGSLQVKTNDNAWDKQEQTSITKCYSDVNPTFTLDKETNVYVRLFIASGTIIDETKPITVTPTLTKLS
jgi:hypothetical protein